MAGPGQSPSSNYSLDPFSSYSTALYPPRSRYTPLSSYRSNRKEKTSWIEEDYEDEDTTSSYGSNPMPTYSNSFDPFAPSNPFDSRLPTYSGFTAMPSNSSQSQTLIPEATNYINPEQNTMKDKSVRFDHESKPVDNSNGERKDATERNISISYVGKNSGNNMDRLLKECGGGYGAKDARLPTIPASTQMPSNSLQSRPPLPEEQSTNGAACNNNAKPIADNVTEQSTMKDRSVEFGSALCNLLASLKPSKEIQNQLNKLLGPPSMEGDYSGVFIPSGIRSPKSSRTESKTPTPYGVVDCNAVNVKEKLSNSAIIRNLIRRNENRQIGDAQNACDQRVFPDILYSKPKPAAVNHLDGTENQQHENQDQCIAADDMETNGEETSIPFNRPKGLKVNHRPRKVADFGRSQNTSGKRWKKHKNHSSPLSGLNNTESVEND